MEKSIQLLESYQNPDIIYESNNSLIYRGFEEKNKRPVILKVFKNKSPSTEETSRFDQEFELLNRFKNEGVIQVYGLLKVDGFPTIVMEDIGGKSLADTLKSKQLQLNEFLKLGVQIAEIIANIHKRNIIHKDINPSNIVWNSEKDLVKIIDFGLATGLPREHAPVINPNALQGTVAFISPEQTGRMNRYLDYRTDFYSLGVTFYWMLTGQLPFKSNDLLKLVYSHIAIQPIPPFEIDSNIPKIVSEIVMKLMAKNAEDRYLDAFGLKADLVGCQQELANTGAIKSIKLGQEDISNRFQIPQKLYGRKEEIDTLMSAFERARKNRAELMLVSGNSGIGKSMLINEIQRTVVEHRGYFITGKFEKFQKDIPYSGIIQAFTILAKQILAQDEAEITLWKDEILAVLGPNGNIVTEMVPIFELIIGKQPEVSMPGPVESQNRFDRTIQGFLKALASHEHPCVIFLDDLQWADLASLHLLKLLTTDSDIKHLLMIGAYRQNETPDSHPLILTLDEIKQTAAKVTSTFLQPLNTEHISQLLGDTLNHPTEDVKPLAELLVQKTQGNPFFLHEFLKTIHQERLILFSFERGWSWYIKGIEARQTTDNVIDFLAANLSGLSENVQDLLKTVACIGSSVNLTTLTKICEKSKEEALQALDESLQTGLLNRIDNAYYFSHDCVLEAAYSLLPMKEKTLLHYRIGNLELQNISKQDLPDNIFYIVNQLNAGVDLVTKKAERHHLSDLNLTAGTKALISHAYGPALNYFKVGIGLLEENCWQTDYEFTLEIFQKAIIAAQLNAEYELMDKLSEEVLLNAVTTFDQLIVYEAKISTCVAQNQLLEGIRIGLRILKKLGVWFHEKPSKLRIVYELLMVKLFLIGKSGKHLINLPELKDPHKLAVMRILFGIATSAYYVAPDLHPWALFKMIRLSAKYGNSLYSPYSYAALGVVHCGVLRDYDSGYEWGNVAQRLVEKLKTRDNKAKVWVVVWFLINHWKNPLKDSINPILEAYKTGLATGDLECAAISAHTYSLNLFLSGADLQKVEKETSKYAGIIRKLNHDLVLDYHRLFHQVLLNLRGMSENPCKIIGLLSDENNKLPEYKRVNDTHLVLYIYCYQLYLNYLFENNEVALQNAKLVELNMIDAHAAQPIIPLYYFFHSLTCLAHYHTKKKSIQKKLLKKVIKNQKRMKKWAFHSPVNYSHKFHLVEAEIARVLGQELNARKHYGLAVKLSRQNQFLNEEALALKLTAKFWLGMNEQKVAALYMAEACHTYRTWGADALVKDTEEKYGYLFTSNTQGIDLFSKTTTIKDSIQVSSTLFNNGMRTSKNMITNEESTLTGSLRTNRMGGLDFFDMSTVIKASQAISREMDLEKLLEKMIIIIMENAGAEKGYIILNKNNELLIEAAANTNSTEIQVLKSIKVDECNHLSNSIVNYVLRTGKSVVLPNENDEDLFINDSYIKANLPKSVLCIPMRYMDKTNGILYLENNITTSAFTKERIEILNILLSQAVISLENAFVYNHLDELVKERTAQLEAAQAILIENAHKAGMADIANETMHNVGNILNSIKTSGHLIEENYRAESFFYNFKKANELLRENLNNIDHFIVDNPKGKKLMEYFLLLEESMDENVCRIKKNVHRLLNKVDLIADVVSFQQNYAGAASLTETCNLSDIIEDALAIKQEDLATHYIIVEKKIDDIDDIPVQKAKLIHIIVNLINNAKEAMSETALNDRKLIFRLYANDVNTYIKVKDTGLGLSPDNLLKIFNHGYSTKRNGHGFGLHSCANYMAEMGGKMWAESEGEGKGAKFILEFPNSIK